MITSEFLEVTVESFISHAKKILSLEGIVFAWAIRQTNYWCNRLLSAQTEVVGLHVCNVDEYTIYIAPPQATY